MCIAVIHDFEVINVDEKNRRDQVRVSCHLGDDALQPSQKQHTIRKTGEHIVCGVKYQFSLSIFSLGYVAGVIDNSADVFVLYQVSNNALEMEPSSICMSQPKLQYPVLSCIRSVESRFHAHRFCDIVWMQEIADVRSHETISLHRKNRMNGRTSVFDSTTRIGDEDDVG